METKYCNVAKVLNLSNALDKMAARQAINKASKLQNATASEIADAFIESFSKKYDTTKSAETIYKAAKLSDNDTFNEDVLLQLREKLKVEEQEVQPLALHTLQEDLGLFYPRHAPIDTFRARDFQKNVTTRLLLSDKGLLYFNTNMLNKRIAEYKEQQYKAIYDYLNQQDTTNTYIDSIFDENGEVRYEYYKTLNDFRNLVEEMSSDETAYQEILNNEQTVYLRSGEQTDFIKAMNAYINLTHFDELLQTLTGTTITIKSPGSDLGIRSQKYSLGKTNALVNTWRDEEFNDAFKEVSRLSKLLIGIIPTYNTEGKFMNKYLTPVLVSKAFINLYNRIRTSQALEADRPDVVEDARKLLDNPQFYLTRILNKVFENGNRATWAYELNYDKSSLNIGLDEQDWTTLYSIYRYIYNINDKESIVSKEAITGRSRNDYSFAQCISGFISRITDLNYKNVKLIDSEAEEYQIQEKPKYYSSKEVYSLVNGINGNTHNVLANENLCKTYLDSLSSQSITVALNEDYLLTVTNDKTTENFLKQGETNYTIKITKDGKDVTEQVLKDFTDAITNGDINTYSAEDTSLNGKNESGLFEFLNDTLNLDLNSKVGKNTLQILESTGHRTWKNSMIISAARTLYSMELSRVYHNADNKVSYKENDSGEMIENGVYDIVSYFRDPNYNGQVIFTSPQVAVTTDSSIKRLRPVSVGYIWASDYAEAQAMMNDTQASNTTNDVFKNHQPNYSQQMLGTFFDHELVKFKNPNFAASKNLFASNNSLIKRIMADTDIQLKNGVRKRTKDMSGSELLFNSIIMNFWSTQKGAFTVQAATTSDKTKFLNYVIDSKQKLTDGIIRGIDFSTMSETPVWYGKTLEEISKNKDLAIAAIYDTLGAQYRKALDNCVAKYEKIFNTTFGGTTSVEKARAIDAYLKQYHYTEQELMNGAQAAGVELQLDAEYMAKKGQIIGIGPLLYFNNAYTYNNIDFLKQRLSLERKKFLNNLINQGLVLYKNSQAKNVVEKVIPFADRAKWNGDKSFHLALDSEGNPITNITASEDFELNPVLERYFYMDVLLSNNLRVGMTGFEYSDPCKVKGVDNFVQTFDPTNPELIDTGIKIESNQWNTSNKRNNIIPATMQTMQQNVLNGIARNIKVAVFRDIKAPVFSIRGKDSSVDSQDGSAFVTPFQAILENGSLQDQSVGDDKKTIWHAYHADNSTACQLKFATYVLSNERMKASLHSDVNMYDVFKRMTNIQWDFDNVNIAKYALRDIFGKNLYYEYFNNGEISYRKIDNLSRDSNGNYYTTEYRASSDGATGDEKYRVWHFFDDNSNEVRIEQPVEYSTDANGRVVENEVIPPATPEGLYTINSLFELHKALGGIYSKEVYVDKDGAPMLVDSEISNEAVVSYMNNTNIKKRNIPDGISKEEWLKDSTQMSYWQPLKDMQIAYAANNSAVKRGVRNINSSDTWSNHDMAINYMTLNSDGLGVQMDPDHDKAENHITQFSQVITALEAGGRLHNVAQSVYDALGQIAILNSSQEVDAINKYLNINDSTSPEEINKIYSQVYDIIGRTIVQQYNKSNENEISDIIINRIAERFNLNETHDQDDYKIPFSDPGIYNKVIPTFISIMNGKSIKGKYPGLACVLCPGFGYMQLHKIGNEHYSTDELFHLATNDGGFRISSYYPKISPTTSDQNILRNTVTEAYLQYKQDLQEVEENPSENWQDNLKYSMQKVIPSDVIHVKYYYTDENGNELMNQFDYNIATLKDYYKIKNRNISYEESLRDLIQEVNGQIIPEGSKIVVSQSVIKPRDLAPQRTYWTYTDENGNTNTINLYDVDDVYNAFISESTGTAHDQGALQKTLDNIHKGVFTYNGTQYTINKDSLVDLPAEAVMSNIYGDTFNTNHMTFNQAMKSPQLQTINHTIPKAVMSGNTRYDLAFIGGKNKYILFHQPKEYSGITSKVREINPKYTRLVTEGDSTYLYATDREGRLLYKLGRKDGDNIIRYVTAYNQQTTYKNTASNNELLYVDKEAIVDDGFEVSEILSDIYNYSGSYCGVIPNFNTMTQDTISDMTGIDQSDSYKSYVEDLTKALKDNNLIQQLSNLSDLYADKERNAQRIEETRNSVNDAINQMQQGIVDDYFKVLSSDLRTSFLRSQFLTAARIPAQALQSFMKMKVIGWSQTEKNRIYVSPVQTWLQGSDYTLKRMF